MALMSASILSDHIINLPAGKIANRFKLNELSAVVLRGGST